MKNRVQPAQDVCSLSTKAATMRARSKVGRQTRSFAIYGGRISGRVSSIHRRFCFFTTMGLFPTLSSSLSAKRPLLGRAGQGNRFDVDTVTTAAMKVNPKTDDTKLRRWVKRNAFVTDILQLFQEQTLRHGRCSTVE